MSSEDEVELLVALLMSAGVSAEDAMRCIQQSGATTFDEAMLHIAKTSGSATQGKDTVAAAGSAGAGAPSVAAATSASDSSASAGASASGGSAPAKAAVPASAGAG